MLRGDAIAQLHGLHAKVSSFLFLAYCLLDFVAPYLPSFGVLYSSIAQIPIRAKNCGCSFVLSMVNILSCLFDDHLISAVKDAQRYLASETFTAGIPVTTYWMTHADPALRDLLALMTKAINALEIFRTTDIKLATSNVANTALNARICKQLSLLQNSAWAVIGRMKPLVLSLEVILEEQQWNWVIDSPIPFPITPNCA
jgi:hypothetical protein